jgi:hypothetical protein
MVSRNFLFENFKTLDVVQPSAKCRTLRSWTWLVGRDQIVNQAPAFGCLVVFIGQRNLHNLYLGNFAAEKDKAESLSLVAVVQVR